MFLDVFAGKFLHTQLVTLLLLQICFTEWIEEMGWAINLHHFRISLVVIFACVAVGNWDKVPASIAMTTLDPRYDKQPTMTDAQCLDVLTASMGQLGTGCLIRSCVASLSFNYRFYYNFFARRNTPADCCLFELRSVWLLPRETPKERYPGQPNCEQQTFFANVDFSWWGMAAVGWYLQERTDLWTQEWVVTGTYCINHGYYDAFVRQRHGMHWATEAGVLGAFLHMPQQSQRGAACLTHRSRARGCEVTGDCRQSSTREITLQEVFRELLLHSAASLLLRLTCRLDGRDEYLLVDVLAPHEFRASDKKAPVKCPLDYDKEMFLKPGKTFYAHSALSFERLAMAARQAAGGVYSETSAPAGVRDTKSKMKVD